jgi:hypothetical protein
MSSLAQGLTMLGQGLGERAHRKRNQGMSIEELAEKRREDRLFEKEQAKMELERKQNAALIEISGYRKLMAPEQFETAKELGISSEKLQAALQAKNATLSDTQEQAATRLMRHQEIINQAAEQGYSPVIPESAMEDANFLGIPLNKEDTESRLQERAAKIRQQREIIDQAAQIQMYGPEAVNALQQSKRITQEDRQIGNQEKALEQSLRLGEQDYEQQDLELERNKISSLIENLGGTEEEKQAVKAGLFAEEGKVGGIGGIGGTGEKTWFGFGPRKITDDDLRAQAAVNRNLALGIPIDGVIQKMSSKGMIDNETVLAIARKTGLSGKELMQRLKRLGIKLRN